MPANNEENPIESARHGTYDGRVDVRLAVVEKRVSAVEVDVAVIRTSFATKEDVASLRNEIHASTERIIGLLHEHKLEFNIALAKQREDFFAALAAQREEFKHALAAQREEFKDALAAQREDFKDALAKQREEFKEALGEQRITLYKMQISHMWKLYGFASLLMTGVYFIARYVH
jgi:hypothetical protein